MTVQITSPFMTYKSTYLLTNILANTEYFQSQIFVNLLSK